jgi:hypothetical protein
MDEKCRRRGRAKGCNCGGKMAATVKLCFTDEGPSMNEDELFSEKNLGLVSESLSRASLGFGRLLFPILRRRRRFERTKESRRSVRDLGYCGLESVFVRLRRLRESADLPYELQRCCPNFFVRHRRIEIEQGFYISAHKSPHVVTQGQHSRFFARRLSPSA